MAGTQRRITRDDLEAKFRSVQGDVSGAVQDRKRTLVTATAAGGFVLLLLVFLLGRRAGKKKTTIVEIRRV